MSMKIKVKIKGPKVHDVGYRYFLMSSAIDMGLKGFQARNRVSGTDQEVIALVEGDEEAIADFKALVESKKPEHADVSNIAFDDYDSDVMKTGEYAQVCTALQLNKAIPLLLAMKTNTDAIPQIRDDLKATRKTGDETLGKIKGMREDIHYASNFRQV